MEYTSKLLVDFLKKLIVFDKDSRSVIEVASRVVRDRDAGEKDEWGRVRSSAEQQAKNYSSKVQSIVTDFQRQMDNVLSYDIRDKSNTFTRLQKCKEALALVSSAEKSITHKDVYEANKGNSSQQMSMSVDDIIQGKIDFIAMAYDLNEVLKGSKKRETASACASFYNTCRTAEALINQEIITLRSSIIQNREALHTRYSEIANSSHQVASSEWTSALKSLIATADKYAKQRQASFAETEKVSTSSADVLKQRLSKLVDTFCQQFPPQEFAEEYSRLYSLEPSFENYNCYKEMPRNVHISTLEYDISTLGLSDYTKAFLDRYYFFLYRDNKLCIPYCASFSPEFNYLFKFNGEDRQNVVKNACDLGMRLFMMLPPRKIKFTFIDPVKLGDSFAIFRNLVSSDDRSSEVINGKIWSDPSDIENKLRTMTGHISDVTQGCLRGKYPNIYEYNKDAGQNAEAYQILMLMDFPAGFSEQSLRMLEQIVTSGPKCGVFTIIYRSKSQYDKVSERMHPLISNIENNFQEFTFSEDSNIITCSGEKVKDKPLIWSSLPLPNTTQLNEIMGTLKDGIKNADKVVIGIDEMKKVAKTTTLTPDTIQEKRSNTTQNGIRIPIGVHGANEVQYLTLGSGGSHHALIAGVAGAGKSSLLHTIILQALTQYGPDELRIYLVDFKRGVEFKIYADYKLPSFEVVAIESEREFGYNILKALEDEQRIRADKFKRVKDRKIDRIEDYRALGDNYKMPRILVIMDEFHELFSNTNDQIGRESSEMMERIVRQGRAFGVHIILSSQSYANVGGLDKSVYDQMAVRIVLKCSKADATMLLGEGSSDVEQISIDDPGRAIYNSEAGNKEYNSHFRVAFIDPSKHRSILEKVSETTSKLSDNETRILLSNIEDNKYSIFNQFSNYSAKDCDAPGRLHIGEVLSVDNNLRMELTRTEYSNMLMVGSDSDKARSMFAFAMLSLAINYWVSHGKSSPAEPFIYFLNYKPLRHRYFIDAPALLAEKILTKYVKNIPVNNTSEIKGIIEEMYNRSITTEYDSNAASKYLMVFGYQRAEDLKSEEKAAEQQDILSMMSAKPKGPSRSTKEMVETILTQGSKHGVHAIFWQDDFKALDIADRKLMTYFYHKIAFDMPKEDFSQFVGVNDVSQFSENTAVYNNRIDDTQNFRPYQSPDRTWLEDICEQLNK